MWEGRTVAKSSKRRRKFRRLAQGIAAVAVLITLVAFIGFLVLMSIPKPSTSVQRFRVWAYANLPIPYDMFEDDVWRPLGTPSEWRPRHHSADEVRMAVAVLTRNDPDFPKSWDRRVTTRWNKPVVTYRITLPGYPARFRSEVVRALTWGARQGGFTVAPAEPGSEPDIEVVMKEGNGAFASGSVDGPTGELYFANVKLGCCRLRALWEDMTQAFGPLADRADARSLYSNTDAGLIYPSNFDAWVFCLLYSLPPRSTSAAIRAKAAELETTRPERCPVLPAPSP